MTCSSRKFTKPNQTFFTHPCLPELSKETAAGQNSWHWCPHQGHSAQHCHPACWGTAEMDWPCNQNALHKTAKTSLWWTEKGKWAWGGPKKCYKDSLKSSLNSFHYLHYHAVLCESRRGSSVMLKRQQHKAKKEIVPVPFSHLFGVPQSFPGSDWSFQSPAHSQVPK